MNIPAVVYEVEMIANGWVVWRTVGSKESIALRRFPYQTAKEAEAAIESAIKSDRGAATRLGFEGVHVGREGDKRIVSVRTSSR